MKIFLWSLASAGVSFAALCGVASHFDLRIVHGDSMPNGFYIRDSRPAVKGDYVAFETPPEAFAFARDRGYLIQSEGRTLVKRLFAGEGDTVLVRDDGVWINGKVIPNSRPQPYDSAGRAMEIAWIDRKLGTGEFFVMSTLIERSFDSRYFGPVHEVAAMRPLSISVR